VKPFALALGLAIMACAALADAGLRHYRSADWGFGLDIPVAWRGYPPDRNSPAEIVRFYPDAPGISLLIVFRKTHDAKETLNEAFDSAERNLAKQGYAHFKRGQARLGEKAALTLDFDRPTSAGTWSCREYFIFDESGDYVLGFGTSNRDGFFPLYERVANTFVVKD
jgi:hypothetical protein